MIGGKAGSRSQTQFGLEVVQLDGRQRHRGAVLRRGDSYRHRRQPQAKKGGEPGETVRPALGLTYHRRLHGTIAKAAGPPEVTA